MNESSITQFNESVKPRLAGINAAPTSKKISFFAAMLIVMGSSIGAGIFFKSQTVLDLSQSSLILAIFSWIVSAISVIAMGLALVEIGSARNDNLSMIGWTKVFNSRMVFKASKNFMFYVYAPLTYFFMPLYALVSFQDGIGSFIHADASPLVIGTNADWAIWGLIAIFLSIYFIFVTGMSSRVGNMQNKIITSVKFLPLALVAIVGFVLAGILPNQTVDKVSSLVVNPPSFSVDVVQANGSKSSLSFLSSLANGASLQAFVPGLGLFLAVGAIFFAFDGFYITAGLQSEMREPKKTPYTILVGLGITTLIYVILAVSMTINGGSFYAMKENMMRAFGHEGIPGRVLFGIISLGIAFGILGIINGSALWFPRFTEDLLKEGELPFAIKYINKLNPNCPKIGIRYTVSIYVPIAIVFTIIGGLGYIQSDSYAGYGIGLDRLYNFADLMATWTSVFAFSFIAASIYGGLKNRKTKKIITDQKSYFKPMAIISVIIVTISMGITIVMPILDMFLLSQVNPHERFYANGSSYLDIVVSRIVTVVVLLIYAFFTFLVSFLENVMNIKKFGSLEKYEAWQKEHFKVS
ncbi:APC family permease [[Mycoplasma] testudinis]|uniref:APC family permease n=1 Tax=[Mycoplasma] testudinis TaxID=33924 RepID=UPI0006991568|nr:APC family permease [[Mycoplasma] testudinis]